MLPFPAQLTIKETQDTSVFNPTLTPGKELATEPQK